MIEQFHNPVFLWCLVGIIMFIIEFMVPGFVIFFFGLGALIVALIAYLIPISLNTQLILFIITSIITLVLLRKWFKNIFSGIFNRKDAMPKNIESYIGKIAVVTEDIHPNSPGKIEFHGTDWKAIADIEIKKGENIVVVKQDNITFEVKKI